MSKALALLIGIKDDGACRGAELDVDNMHRLLYLLGYDVCALKTGNATYDRIMGHLNSASSVLDTGDIFVFFFSGKGGENENLCAVERDIGADELNAVWLKMKQGVRIVNISVSCHTETDYKDRETSVVQSAPVREPDHHIAARIRSQMIHMRGYRKRIMCITEWPECSAFTAAILKAWGNGTFNGDYPEFHKKIVTFADYPGKKADPVYEEYGPVTQEFRSQRPFTIWEGCKTIW